MPAATRIYLVNNSVTHLTHLVRASSQAQAVKHVVERNWSAEVPTPEQLVELTIKGVKVQDATKADE